MMEVDAPAPSHFRDDAQGDSPLICYLKTKLPLELFLRLTDFMEDSALLNLRLSCRELEDALLPIFRKRFFTKRHVYLGGASLHRLVAISNEPRLAGHVSAVSIGYSSSRDQEGEDNLLILDSGYDVELLTHAFSNMPNLKDVTIKLNPLFLTPGPHAGADLLRDGWRKLLRKALRALSLAGRELRALDMHHRGGSGGGSFISDLYISDSVRDAFARPLLSLKSLTLALDPRPQQYRPNDLSALLSFLTIPRDLEHLRINFDRNAVVAASAVLKSLTQATPTLPLSHLSQLDLGKMTVTAESLVDCVRSFAGTLTRLQFFRIGLIHGVSQDYPPGEHPQEPQGDPPRVQALLWKRVFKELAAMPELEKLTGFYAGFLTERVRKEQVAFLQTSPKAVATLPSTEYTGVDARRFLEELAENVVVFPKQTRIEVILSDGESNSEGDEDDEDDDEDGSDSD